MKKQNSNFGKLKKADFWKGLLMAVLSSFTATLVSIFSNLSDLNAINWNYVLIAGCIGCLAYLQKNLFSNSDGEILKKENSVMSEDVPRTGGGGLEPPLK